jgi:LPXTG-motif cell wall-anchored protein
LVNNPKALLSDIVRITGMGTGNDVGTFLLKMSYDLDQPQFAGLHENSLALSGELQLAWLNDSNQWVNAVLGNQGGTAHFAGIGAPTGSEALGTWGIDTSATGGQGYVWAVLNHNSDFAVIPEPSTFVLGGLALLGFAGMGLRRRRQKST